MTKNIAIYCRVSTNHQDADNQVQILKDYCTKSQWTVYDVFVDVITGSKDSRPAWDRLFVLAHQKQFNIVLFWSFDRFSRAGTLYTLQKLHELELLGIGYLSYQEPYIDSVGMFRDTVISIFATIAKAERERISERTRAGLKCQCGHKLPTHGLNASPGFTGTGCVKCDCQQFVRAGARRGKDRKPRSRKGYY